MKPSASVLRWSRSISPADRIAWESGLAFVPCERIIWIEPVNKRRITVEVYPATKAFGAKLVRLFGGKLQQIQPAQWLAASAPPAPRVMGRRLVIVHSTEQKQKAVREGGHRHVLHVPAGMAFGTGEHATTSLIVRRVIDSDDLVGARMLDLGTGSGILALAARLAGAKEIVGMDYDPICIRTAIANEKLNFRRPAIRWVKADVLMWKAPGKFRLVTANLFRDLLIGAAARIWGAVAEDGTLILSGLLRNQAEEVSRVYRKLGARNPQVLKKGKWCCLIYLRVSKK